MLIGGFYMAISMRMEHRACTTKGQLRQIRQTGFIPAIVYGKQLTSSEVISVSEKELQQILRTQPNAVIELQNGSSSKQTVMISEVQRDSLSGKLMHVDFLQINMSDKVRTNIRIELSGDSVGVKNGGIQQLILHELEVQCLPAEIPDTIIADVTNLAVGESLVVQDLYLPEGVEAKTEHDAVVVTILAPQKEEETEEDVLEHVEEKQEELLNQQG